MDIKSVDKPELVKHKIKEVEVALNDRVRSRLTGRFGKVVGIHTDAQIVDVKWENDGSTQALTKYSLLKVPSGEDVHSLDQLSTYSTTNSVDTYKNMSNKNRYEYNTASEEERLEAEQYYEKQAGEKTDSIKEAYNKLSYVVDILENEK